LHNHYVAQLSGPNKYYIANSTVEHWIEKSNGFVADISLVNMNVTYEIGYALGLGLPLRLIRSSNSDFKKVQEIGLLDTLAHDSYDFQPKLRQILSRDDQTPQWVRSKRNKDQPLFILQPPIVGDVSRKTLSSIKKIARMKFRSFNPAEISRFTASEAFEAVTSSFGVLAFWMDDASDAALRNNQRSVFIYGLGRGLGIPSVLLAHESSALPLDIQDTATRWSHLDSLDEITENFRNAVAEEIVQHPNEQDQGQKSKLGKVSFGEPIAENEQAQLSKYFIKTDSFRSAVDGSAHVLTGRKGSGKSAIFLQVRDVSRSNKQNIVVDLMPSGYQLIKLKEYILDKLSYGTRKEVISAFWEYIIWLEIAYKILEKDAAKSRNDPETFERYEQLRTFFDERVDTGEGDFSERLGLLADNVVARFSAKENEISDTGALKSSEVLEIIYGQDLRDLRENVLGYLKIKGFVLFLFDNLDRIWTPGGFNADDAQILVGLAEAMQEIERKFRRKSLDFRWILFIRSDVYEFLIAGMADYGKLSTSSLEWTDRDQLRVLFNQRLLSGFAGSNSTIQLSDISVPIVHGASTLDYLIDGCLMRPRYLIRLFETARRRALTLNHQIIDEDDYDFAVEELGWQVLEDLDREITDLVNDASSFLFDVVAHSSQLTSAKLKYMASARLNDKKDIDRLIDLMIWNGSLGVQTAAGNKFIFNVGYKRRYLANLIEADSSVPLCLHPTLSRIAQ
jgi:hypothetical protein